MSRGIRTGNLEFDLEKYTREIKNISRVFVLWIGKTKGMENGRIYFEGNPWPEGHPIKELETELYILDGYVWLKLNLETAEYYSERDINADDIKHASDWEAPSVWNNYRSCHISSDKGFPVCPTAEFSLDKLTSQMFRVDTLPFTKSWGDFAFNIYLLGHDSVADHKIQFFNTDENLFDISWEGKIALSYVGGDEFKYSFKVKIRGVKISLPEIE